MRKHLKYICWMHNENRIILYNSQKDEINCKVKDIYSLNEIKAYIFADSNRQ